MRGDRHISLGSNIIRAVADLGVEAGELIALVAGVCVWERWAKRERAAGASGSPPIPSHSEVKLVGFQGGRD